MGGAVSIGMGRRECRAVGADAAPLVPDRGAAPPIGGANLEPSDDSDLGQWTRVAGARARSVGARWGHWARTIYSWSGICSICGARYEPGR